jgi:hypothetical protein
MIPGKAFLQERLYLLEEAAPVEVDVTLEHFKTFESAREYHMREVGVPLRPAHAFAAVWDEHTEEKQFTVGVIGVIEENWPEYAETLEDIDGILAEEYFHVCQKVGGDFDCDNDCADYMALARAIEVGMTPEIASFNLKHLQAVLEDVKANPQDHANPVECMNQFARAAALLNGAHKPVYARSVHGIHGKVYDIMYAYVDSLPPEAKKAVAKNRELLLSDAAYQDSHTAEHVKSRLQ